MYIYVCIELSSQYISEESRAHGMGTLGIELCY
jgi:hypothetical protein